MGKALIYKHEDLRLQPQLGTVVNSATPAPPRAEKVRSLDSVLASLAKASSSHLRRKEHLGADDSAT